jgi:hypothetical protein
LINFIVDMVGFVHPQKEVVMNAFSALLSAWNGGESKGGVDSGELKSHNAITQCMTIIKTKKSISCVYIHWLCVLRVFFFFF